MDLTEEICKIISRHDLPNWVTMILPPIWVWFWNQFSRDKVPNLKINPFVEESGGLIQLRIQFWNTTGQTVFILNPKLYASKEFPVYPSAAKDSTDSSYELKFPEKSEDENEGIGECRRSYTFLKTSDKTHTLLRLEKLVDITKHKRNFVQKVFRKPRFYTLKFAVMVGEKKRLKISMAF